jgi:putative methyltransferase (TIGR04325 family)
MRLPIKASIMQKPIWENIYSSFAQIENIGDGFNSKQWIQSLEEKLLAALNNQNYKNMQNGLIEIVIAMQNKQNISCLDFGGGAGLAYLSLVNSICEPKNIFYTVVDSAKSCEIANKYLHQYKNLIFSDTLPNEKSYDIVYSSSAIQYIDDWQGVLKKLASYNPEYLVFNDFVGCDNPSFITHQNYYDSKLPYRFYNLGEFVNFLQSLNYKLIYKTNFQDTILGVCQKLPMENFEEKYQVGYSKNLIFCKDSKC